MRSESNGPRGYEGGVRYLSPGKMLFHYGHLRSTGEIRNANCRWCKEGPTALMVSAKEPMGSGDVLQGSGADEKGPGAYARGDRSADSKAGEVSESADALQEMDTDAVFKRLFET